MSAFAELTLSLGDRRICRSKTGDIGKGQGMLSPDGHVHSQWSWDALAGLMEDTCLCAVEFGLPSVKFTEHADHFGERLARCVVCGDLYGDRVLLQGVDELGDGTGTRLLDFVGPHLVPELTTLHTGQPLFAERGLLLGIPVCPWRGPEYSSVVVRNNERTMPPGEATRRVEQ